MKTWILVANRAGARVLEHIGPGKGLKAIEQIDHSEGRKKSSEIVSDRSGSATTTHGSGPHAMTASVSPHDQVAQNFARSLAKKMGQHLIGHQFDRLVLVAEPHFLGLLRSSLDTNTTAKVIGTVNKDLEEFPIEEIGKHLGEVIAV